MKKRYISLLLFTASLTLTSCGFISFVKRRLTKIEISDQNISYLVGQTYYSDNALTVNGTYSDDTYETFSLEDVTISLTLKSKTYNPKSAFTDPGEYTLSVSKDNVRSNIITLSVFEEVQYVSSMNVVGETSMYTNNITSLTVNVTPAKFTVPISAVSSNSSVARVSKVSNTEFDVTAIDEGEVDISFSALRGENDYLTVNHHIVITKKTTVDMAYTYEDVRSHYYYNTPGFPLSGQRKMLVIPVWFTDSGNYIKSNYKNTVIEDIRKSFFGTTTDTGWHSVSSYYYQESSHRLLLDGVVSSWYECGLSAATVSEYKNSNNLAIDAADWYFRNNANDFRSDYDGNEDGYIDSVMLIYASPDYQVNKSFGSNMWAYCFWVQDQSQKSTDYPGVNTYLWASYDFMYGSNYAYTHTGYNYSNGDTTNCKLDAHTYIHETGHVFGLDDYYDYAKKEERLNPAGGFSMQDNNVGGHDAFSVTAFGWSNVYIPTESCELTISDFQTSRQVVILSPSWNEYDSPFDEYMLLELYAPTGLNQFDCEHKYQNYYPIGPNEAGIRLWHVDARLIRLNSFTTNASLQGIRVGLNNTSTTSDAGGRTCEAGSAYQSYNLLQLIRNSTSETYTSKNDFSNADLFRQGSVYSQSTFSKQFPRSTLLNSGISLGWSFTVSKILSDDGVYKATIRFTKA